MKSRVSPRLWLPCKRRLLLHTRAIIRCRWKWGTMWWSVVVRALSLTHHVQHHFYLYQQDISPYHDINRVYQWGKVLPQLMATFQILVSFFLLLIHKDLMWGLVAVGMSSHICGMNFNNCHASRLWETKDARAGTLFVKDGERSVVPFCWLSLLLGSFYLPWGADLRKIETFFLRCTLQHQVK